MSDVLKPDAPHLVAETPELRRSYSLARDAGQALKLAIGNARVELDDRGEVSEATWNLLDLLGEQLVDRLAELERADRLASAR